MGNAIDSHANHKKSKRNSSHSSGTHHNKLQVSAGCTPKQLPLSDCSNAAGVNQDSDMEIETLPHAATTIQVFIHESCQVDLLDFEDARKVYFESCRSGDLENVSSMLQQYPELAETSDGPHQQTGFLNGCNFGYCEIVEFFLENYPSSKFDYDALGRDCLVISIENGHIDCVKLILNQNVDAQFAAGVLAAVKLGNFEILKLLLELQPELIRTADFISGRSAFSYAVETCNCEAITFLYEKWPESLYQRDKLYDMSPAHWACKSGRFDVVTMMQEQWDHSLIFALSSSHRSALSYAAESGSLELVKFLIDLNPEALKLADDFNRLPLFYAVQCGKLENARLLLDSWPESVKIVHESGLNLLELAACQGNTVLVKFLFEIDGDRAYGALLQAIDHQHPEIVELLLENREFDVGDEDQLVQRAVASGNVSILAKLFEKFPQLDCQLAKLLNLAIQACNLDVVDFVINRFDENKFTDSALLISAIERHRPCVEEDSDEQNNEHFLLAYLAEKIAERRELLLRNNKPLAETIAGEPEL